MSLKEYREKKEITQKEVTQKINMNLRTSEGAFRGARARKERDSAVAVHSRGDSC